MKEYQAFVSELQDHITAFSTPANEDWTKKANKYLNGLAYDSLRSLVPLQDRRKSGAFFTGHEMAAAVLDYHKINFGKEVVFYDPACGTANLLIAAAQKYSDDLLRNGAKVSYIGTDIHQEFVHAGKLRFDLFKTIAANFPSNCDVQILREDGMLCTEYYKRATHILVNPPFNKVESPRNIDWAKGKVSNAALFINKIAAEVKPGTQVIAILPEVLRSGSRYTEWRKYISSAFAMSDIHLLGQFDRHTDIDVFSVLLTKSENPLPPNWVWTKTERTISKTISSDFDVSVGTVVDNRDKTEGVERPYLVSRGLLGWTTISECNRRRKHSGKTYSSPLVVIKRTSRVGDAHRTIATIVNLEEPLYIDNHLIVLIPKSGKISTCRSLLKKLKSRATTDFVDQQIRCRHLTVKVVSNIPT